MKTSTHTQPVASKTPPTKLGPGEYRPAGIFQRVEDLPKPKIIKQRRESATQPCPQCGQAAARHRSYTRQLYDVGDLLSGRPRLLEVTYSQHYCSTCQKYFNLDLSDLAAPKSLYTHRVQDLAVRLVVDDALPYRTASWHLWRDHRVFVPFATIQNWVEAGGKKGQ
jgi:transposase